jgi:hypothetical protein
MLHRHFAVVPTWFKRGLDVTDCNSTSTYAFQGKTVPSKAVKWIGQRSLFDFATKCSVSQRLEQPGSVQPRQSQA